MSDKSLVFDGQLVLSRHLDYFQRGDEYYVYHNLYGYILKMSEDVLEFLEYFREAPREALQTEERFRDRFEDTSIMEFANVFSLQRCLVEPEDPEEEPLLKYYPVHAPWIVYHQPATGPVTICALDQDTKQQVFVAKLNEWDSELWRRIDGNTTTADLIESMRDVKGSPVGGLTERVIATLNKFTHSNLQVFKMSSKPMSFFEGKRRFSIPPYLKSSMPYDRITEVIRGERSGPQVLIAGLKAEPVSEALRERDRLEKTFSALFSEPHQALNNRTYGGALLGHLLEQPEDNGGGRLLELGAANGTLTITMLDALVVSDPDRYARTQCTVVAIDDEAAVRVREDIQGSAHAERVSVVVVDPEKLSQGLGDDALFDLIICNEVAASLETLPVRRISREIVEEDEETGESVSPTNGKSDQDAYIAEGDAVNIIFRLGLSVPLQDAPPDFHLNIGAIRLLESAHKVLAPDGQLALVEFGELFNYPLRASSDEGEVSYSLHFKILGHVAQQLGYKFDFGYLKEKLGFDGDTNLLASTRSHFAALRHLLASFGVDLQRRAYTQEQFEALLRAGDVDPETIHEVTYQPLDDRALGLVTHSFKLMRVYPEPPDAVEI